MRYRELMTDASGEEEGVLESVITGERIGRDEEEQHRAELERNLEDLSLQLSDPSLAADGEDGDEQKPSESSFSIEFARHNSRRREVTIFHGQNSSLLDNTRLGEDEDADYFPYRSDDDAEVHVVGNTMSTVGHHASTVTLSAGLTGRGGRRAFAAETSLSGAEYDPDRPLDSVLNGVAEELSLLNVDNSLAYAKRTTRHTANAQAQVTFDPLILDKSNPAVVDHAKNHGSSNPHNAKQRKQTQDPATSFLSDRDVAQRLKTKTKRSSLNMQPPTPSTKANATCGSSTTNGSKFTRMAKSLAREIEASQRWVSVPDFGDDSLVKATQKKHATTRDPFRDVVNQVHRSGGKTFGRDFDARMGHPSTKTAGAHFGDLFGHERTQSRIVCLPDVTGLTSVVGSPPRKDQRWPKYSGGSQGERVEAELNKVLTTLQTRLNQLESRNLVSRRRVQELEYELDACKLEVKRERTRVLERDEIIVAQQKDFRKQRATLSRPVRKEPDPANDTRLEELVEEKKSLESLVSTLRLHLSRLTSDLSNHQAQLDELRGLRQKDFSDLRAKITEVDDLKLEVERLAGEVDILRSVIEEGLNERRKAKEFMSFADDSHCSVLGVPFRSQKVNTVRQEDHANQGPRVEIPSPPPSRPQSRQKKGPVDPDNNPSLPSQNGAPNKARSSNRYATRRRVAMAEDCPSEASGLELSREVDERRAARDIRRIRSPRNKAEGDDVDRVRAEPRSRVPSGTHPEASSRPSKDRCDAASPFPRIRGERLEKLFFSAPAHNERTCRVCRRHCRPEAVEDELDHPSWLPPRKRVKTDKDDNRVRRHEFEGAHDKSADENPGYRSRAPFSEDRLPPQTVLARVLRELEDDFTHYKSIYIELADQYKVMDAASNVAKRNVLAEHLKEVIDTLEQKGDQIASLYDLLAFRDKPVKESVVPERKRASRTVRSPRTVRQTRRQS